MQMRKNKKKNRKMRIRKMKKMKKNKMIPILLNSQFISKRAMDKHYAMNVLHQKEKYKIIISYQINVSLVSLIKNIETHKKIPRFERGLTGYLGPDFVSLDEVIIINNYSIEIINGFSRLFRWIWNK